MTDSNEQEQAEDIASDIDRLMSENEFWYLALKSVVATVIRTAGTDAAESLLEQAKEDAIQDFPLHTPEALVSEPCASYMLEDLRNLVKLWSYEKGSIVKHHRANPPEMSDG